MAEKLDEPISHVRGWFNVWIVITDVISYSRMICGACLPSHLRDQDPDWYWLLALSLAQ